MDTSIETSYKCCYGTGVQTNKDGIRIKCPCCGGSRRWSKEKYKRIWE